MSTVFDISKVDLGYSPGATVLHIPELKLKRGQLTFVIGPSGAGKSTLLETLGLMKSTVLSSAQSRLDFNSIDGSTRSLLDLWNDDGLEATHLRSQYFTFIFQSTNLMPNFTLGENICFTGMLNGKTLDQVKPRALELMAELNLDPSLFDQPATMASGGQRQRAAFVRALCKDFEVLFGDEPTGNLDNENAVSLFQLLSNHVKSKNRSAIIVSHDIELSEKFADEIIEIDYGVQNGTGAEIGVIKR